MATPPTFVAEYEAAWNSGTQPKAVTATAVTNDRLVVGAIAETQLAWTAPTGGSYTYTAGPSLNPANYCATAVWTATANTDQTGFSLSVGNDSGTSWWGHNALRFSGSDGIGATASTNTTGAPSLAITTQADNSAIVVFVGDWNATDGASRTWRTVNGTAPSSGNGHEKSYFRDGSHYAIYCAVYPDAGTAGSKTVGLSAPSGQQYTIIAVEVKGAAASGTTANAQEATLTAAAQNAQGAVSPSAVEAAATLAAQNASTAILSPATEAVVALGAQDATVQTSTGTTASAQEATLALSGQDATTTISSSAAEAAVALAGQDATTQIVANALTATLTVTAEFETSGGSTSLTLTADNPVDITMSALDATVSTATQTFANAQAATLTVAGQDSSTTVTATATTATLTSSAENATAVTSVVAQATEATVAVAANDTSASVSASAENAALALSGQNASTQITATPTTAGLTVTGQDATTSAVANAESADLTVTANDATVVIPGSTIANAETAGISVTADSPSAFVLVQAITADMVVAAQSTTVVISESRTADAETALVGLTAQDAQWLITGANPAAQAASVAFGALNASVLITAPSDKPSRHSHIGEAYIRTKVGSGYMRR